MLKKLFALALFALPIFASDCDGSFTLTAAGGTVLFNNQTRACYNWQISYFSSGFSAVSVQFESAPNGATSGVPGTWVAFAGVTLSGSNPNTATTQATTTFAGSFPWVRVRLVSVTGSGSITGRMLGSQLTSAAIGFPSAFTSSFSWPFHAVQSGQFTWDNQGNATDTAGNPAILPAHRVLSNPTGANNNLQIRFKTALVPPFTYDLAFTTDVHMNNNFPVTGICYGDSATGRYSQYGVGANYNMYLQDWTTTTVFSGTVVNNRPAGNRDSLVTFLRYTNDGVNEHFLISHEGDLYSEQATRAAGAFVANQDRIGYCLMDGNTGFIVGLTVYHECLYSGSGVPMGSGTCQ